MRPILPLLLTLPAILTAFSGPARADEVSERNGTDTFISAPAGLPAADAPGDLFATGSSVDLRGTAGGDVHVAGFAVDVELPAPQDLYAAGGSVTLRAPVGSDLTAAGFSVRTSAGAVVGGNARLAGGAVVVDGPVRGALTVTGGDVTLNAEVGGDVLVRTGALTIGPAARIDGRLVYAAPVAADIPATAISPDRVNWRPTDDSGWAGGWASGWREGWHRMPSMPSFLSMFSGTLLVLGFLILLAAAGLMIAPVLTERLRQGAVARPGATLLSGFLGLATLIGLIPVSALTLLGLPLVPFALLLILLFWTFGYLLGAYVLLTALISASARTESGVPLRLLLLFILLAALAALNFIPFLGWLLNVAVMLFGLGAIASPIFFRTGAPLPAAPPAASAA